VAIAVFGGSFGAFLFVGLVHGNPEVWLPAFAAAFAAVLAAVVGPYLTEWLRTDVFAAKFELECLSQPPWYAATKASIPDVDPLAVAAHTMQYYRASVRNFGPVQAQACEVVLEDIWCELGDRWYRLAFWEPEWFHWAGDASGEKTRALSPDRRVFVDIGHVPTRERLSRMGPSISRDWPDAEQMRFALCLMTGYRSQPNVLGPGHYRFGIAIYAANGDCERAWLDLKFRPVSFAQIGECGLLGEGIPDVELQKVRRAPADADDVQTFLGLAELIVNARRAAALEQSARRSEVRAEQSALSQPPPQPPTATQEKPERPRDTPS
jgi:hypothetical protein